VEVWALRRAKAVGLTSRSVVVSEGFGMCLGKQEFGDGQALLGSEVVVWASEV